jgi:hypothetical protein
MGYPAHYITPPHIQYTILRANFKTQFERTPGLIVTLC